MDKKNRTNEKEKDQNKETILTYRAGQGVTFQSTTDCRELFAQEIALLQNGLQKNNLHKGV